MRLDKLNLHNTRCQNFSLVLKVEKMIDILLKEPLYHKSQQGSVNSLGKVFDCSHKDANLIQAAGQGVERYIIPRWKQFAQREKYIFG